MDTLLQHPDAKTHYSLRGLVRESDVAELAEKFKPWFLQSIEASWSAKSFEQQTNLGHALLNFYQEGKKHQSSYVEGFVCGDKWRFTGKRVMPQSVVLRRQRTLGVLQWRTKDYQQFFERLGIAKGGRKAVCQARFWRVIAHFQSLDPPGLSAEPPGKRARVITTEGERLEDCPPLKLNDLKKIEDIWYNDNVRDSQLLDVCIDLPSLNRVEDSSNDQ